MIDAYSSLQRPPLTRAAVIWEAHRYLSALVAQDLPSTPVSESALRWLEERDLIQEVMDETGRLLFEVTGRGREAVMGRQAVQQLH